MEQSTTGEVDESPKNQTIEASTSNKAAADTNEAITSASKVAGRETRSRSAPKSTDTPKKKKPASQESTNKSTGKKKKAGSSNNDNRIQQRTKKPTKSSTKEKEVLEEDQTSESESDEEIPPSGKLFISIRW